VDGIVACCAENGHQTTRQVGIEQDVHADSRSIRLTWLSCAAYFDAQIAQHMADDHIAGATVAVVQADEVLFADYIFIDVQMDETTIFRNCSGLEALVDEVPQ
jgi:hypothetical protein